jgi:hypothetical protein
MQNEDGYGAILTRFNRLELREKAPLEADGFLDRMQDPLLVREVRHFTGV